jgi:hypothetical protein
LCSAEEIITIAPPAPCWLEPMASRDVLSETASGRSAQGLIGVPPQMARSKVRTCHGCNHAIFTIRRPPPTSEAMSEAFRRVCDVLGLDSDAEDSMTELVIAKIVERANAGESDPERLCIDVLAEFEPQGSEPLV